MRTNILKTLVQISKIAYKNKFESSGKLVSCYYFKISTRKWLMEEVKPVTPLIDKNG